MDLLENVDGPLKSIFYMHESRRINKSWKCTRVMMVIVILKSQDTCD